ncbi:hypothetical protein jhhlp_007282 [Lomentospora prolificans]|uniref:F-box domain-containing protein n=1 Tax=Lomentospora prolificans TaxID=41688 RepID=A0A2N3N284_9PEZI|nr:hypothetical protein jhhlp_007282 [Lomentospora prolificans]
MPPIPPTVPAGVSAPYPLPGGQHQHTQHTQQPQQSTLDFILRTERAVARGLAPRAPYPGHSAPTMEPINYADPDMRLLNRPRKLSNSSTSSSNTASRETYSSGTRTSSWSSATSFDSMDFINNRSAEYGYSRSSASSGRPHMYRSKPNEIFAALPGEVLELILDELKKLHLGKNTESCSTCWMRDLCSIMMASKKWSKFARTSLYEDIQLNGLDSTVMKKRYRGCANPRLVLLRRTLRANNQVAVIVHSLKVPAVPEDTPVEAYHDLVASVVMACPNLERLVGLHPRYSHNFDRLYHALSTRQKLKQMDWMVDSVSVLQRPPTRSVTKQLTKTHPTTGHQGPFLTPNDILPSQSNAFLEYHLNWAHLTTLTIHTLPGGSLTPDNLITSAISYLPSLQHLFLSALPFTAFKDDSLLSLPALKTLSLSYLSGITSNGLSNFATRSSSRSIQRLVLRHVNIDEMPALARILSNLIHLENLAFVQSFPPLMPEDNFILLMPYLASNSLQKLHWDITSHPTCANVADSILARSIAAKGFPALRTLRAPNDPEGIFQGLCRPRDRVDMPGDRFRPITNHARNMSGGGKSLSVPASPTAATAAAAAATVKSPTSPAFSPDPWLLAPATNLHQARLAAQARLEAAWRFPRFHCNVVDEQGMLVDKFSLAGFIGATESKILYDLRPDAGAKDENGGLVEVGDVIGDCGEKGGEMCNGRWNMPSGPVDKKDKDKDRWWHVERGRWVGVEM